MKTKNAKRATTIKATDIMTKKVQTLSPTSKISQAIKLTQQLPIRHIPVIKLGKLVGIVSDRDLAVFSLVRIGALNPRETYSILNSPITEIMEKRPKVVYPTASLRQVARLLIKERIGAIPVVDRNSKRLLGMISYIDILQTL